MVSNSVSTLLPQARPHFFEERLTQMAIDSDKTRRSGDYDSRAHVGDCCLKPLNKAIKLHGDLIRYRFLTYFQYLGFRASTPVHIQLARLPGTSLLSNSSESRIIPRRNRESGSRALGDSL